MAGRSAQPPIAPQAADTGLFSGPMIVIRGANPIWLATQKYWKQILTQDYATQATPRPANLEKEYITTLYNDSSRGFQNCASFPALWQQDWVWEINAGVPQGGFVITSALYTVPDG